MHWLSKVLNGTRVFGAEMHHSAKVHFPLESGGALHRVTSSGVPALSPAVRSSLLCTGNPGAESTKLSVVLNRSCGLGVPRETCSALDDSGFQMVALSRGVVGEVDLFGWSSL